MNNMSKKLDQAYCNECGDLVSYTTKEEVIEDVNNGIPFQYRFPISRCAVCGSEVADNLDYNYDKSDARWDAYVRAKSRKVDNENDD